MFVTNCMSNGEVVSVTLDGLESHFSAGLGNLCDHGIVQYLNFVAVT